MGEIYRLEFQNGKSYIGLSEVSAKERFSKHKHCAKIGSTKGLLYNAWRKHGEPTMTVIAIVENYELAATEIRAISVFKTLAPNGYNLSLGGERDPRLNPEVYERFKASVSTAEYRQHKSEIAIRVQSSPEYRANMSASVKLAHLRPEVKAKHAAIKASAEWKRKQSEAKKAMWEQGEYRKKVKSRWDDPLSKDRIKVHPMKNPDVIARLKATWATPEARARKVDASIRRWADPEQRARMSARSKANWQNPEYRAKQTESRRLTWQDPELRAKQSSSMKEIRRKKSW